MIRRWLPQAGGSLLVVGLVWTGRVPEAGPLWRGAFVALHVLGSIGLVVYLRSASVSMRQLLGVALVLRLLALPMLPTLSDDGYRYLWDGLVAAEADVSPYAFRPSDPELAEFRDEVLYESMNSPDYYSVYPPASQLLFRASVLPYRHSGWETSWWLLKVLLVGMEAIGIVALARRVGPTRAALYAWSPLAVIEIAGQGHTEAVVLAGLGAAIWVGTTRVPWGSLGVTTAGLAKLYPMALLPMVWRRDGRTGVAASLGLGAILTALVWAPDAWAHISESLGLFLGTLDAYAAPYRALKAMLYPLVGETAGQWASTALSLVFAAAAGVAVLIDDGTRRGARTAVALVVIAFTLTASTLHPWYWLPVLYIVPLLRIWPLAFLALASPVDYLGYVVPWGGPLALMIGWGGAALLLLFDCRSHRSSVRAWPGGEVSQQRRRRDL